MQGSAASSSGMPKLSEARVLLNFYEHTNTDDIKTEVDRVRCMGHFGDATIVRRTRTVPMSVLKRNRDLFNREIRVMQMVLGHPNVIEYKAHEIRNTGAGTVQLILGMQDGDNDLFERCGEDGDVVPELGNIFIYIQQAAAGLAFIHSKNILHRDLKPENLLLSFEGERSVVRVCDFGLAWDLGQDGSPKDCSGTTEYAAPETLARKKQQLPADIFCFGATIRDMLSWLGLVTPLHDREERLAARCKAFSIPYTDPGHIAKVREPRLASLVKLGKKMLRSKPKDRPTAEQAKRELDDMLAQPKLSQTEPKSSIGPMKREKSYSGMRHDPLVSSGASSSK